MIKTIFGKTWKPTVKAIWIPTRLTSRVVCGGNTCEGAGEIYNEIYMFLWFNQMAQRTINIPSPLWKPQKHMGGVYFMRSGEIFLRNFLSYTPLKYSRAKGGDQSTSIRFGSSQLPLLLRIDGFSVRAETNKGQLTGHREEADPASHLPSRRVVVFPSNWHNNIEIYRDRERVYASKIV